MRATDTASTPRTRAGRAHCTRAWTRCLPWLLTAILAASCGGGGETDAILRLAVTTTVRDSGLLDELLPLFEEGCDCRVDVIATGSGRALALGESGDVDVLLVHARPAEDAFMTAGYGVRREDVMYNAFVLLGPTTDPAGVAALSPAPALQQIARGRHPFVSRGDDSGTHQREQSLWRADGGRPEWDGYLESGRGMGATLMMADQVQAYVLSDRGTFIRFRDEIDLQPVVVAEGDLYNPYGAIVVNPDNHPAIRRDLAERFVDFLLSSRARETLRDFSVGGEQLFFAGPVPADD